MDDKKYLIINDFTGETFETTDKIIFEEILRDLIDNLIKVEYYSPFNDECTTFYRPVKVINEFRDNDEEIIQKAIITSYKEIYNPYSMD